jgi:hypothetical protein
MSFLNRSPVLTSFLFLILLFSTYYTLYKSHKEKETKMIPKIKLEKKVKKNFVSGILIHNENIHLIKRNLKKFNNFTFFSEIVIWNENQIPLNESQFSDEKYNFEIKFINSPSNSKGLSKYFACSLAKNNFCYFQGKKKRILKKVKFLIFQLGRC